MQNNFAVMISCALIGAFNIFALPASHASQPCESPVGRIVSVEGRVEIQRQASSDWLPLSLDDVLCQDDVVRTSMNSRAGLSLINQGVLRIDEQTTIRLLDIDAGTEKPSLIDLIFGTFQSFSRQPRQIKINTPYLNGNVEGTEFVFRVDDDTTVITVFEGTVLASNAQGRVVVNAGESASARSDSRPQKRTIVAPRDAAQWALYYPPLLAGLGYGTQTDMSLVPPALRPSVSAASAGDIAGALSTLDAIPTAAQGVDFFVHRAALLMSVGQVDEAKRDIDSALASDDSVATAYALRAVIALTTNDIDGARADAESAARLDPDLAAVALARSYVQQGQGNIEAALNTMRPAAETHEKDPLVWARLAELWLMMGDQDQALDAANRAQQLAPKSTRVNNVFGFVALASYQLDQATTVFQQAIDIDSADPLPRLGLGLAKIGQGDLAAGRSEIEIAVGLDGNSALLRAYLGKAYFEEKRTPLDAEQFTMAKALDPLDPTAYLYDGIRKQTQNRPIDALKDIVTSLRLNEKRGTFRGQLLLDQDRAARGVSLSRAYQDLGAAELGIVESSTALGIDPANASAHRFLSDSYQGVRRREIARVSELLQSQLLQDVAIYPVQPALAETNLNLVTLGGPARPGYNEFTPLFERKGIRLNASGTGGSNDTLGGETIVSLNNAGYSFSLGAFSQDTDGWRDNNFLDQDIINVHGQVAISPKVNLQAEYRQRDSEEGDLAFNFEPTAFSEEKRVDREQDSGRLGLRITPAANSTLLVSYIDTDREERLRDVEQLDPATTANTDSSVENDSAQTEVQWIQQHKRFNVIAGLAYNDTDTTIDEDIVISDVLFGPLFSEQSTTKQRIRHPRVYGYSNIHAHPAVMWTIGFSYDDFEEGVLEETSFNPKLGVQWRLSDTLRLRAAGFRTLKPVLANNRTVEPTQVAGFNQLFDDINGTKSTRYAGGFDWQPIDTLSISGEVSWRDLDEPTFVVEEDLSERAEFEAREERLYRAMALWTPSPNWAVNAEVSYDRYESDRGFATEFDNLPLDVETWRVPVGVSYFSPSGFFASLTGTFVDQEVERSDASLLGEGADNFYVVDLTLGYKLPKRRGVLSLGVKNLFDEQFRFQDDSFREFRDEPATGPYFPERQVFASVSLNF